MNLTTRTLIGDLEAYLGRLDEISKHLDSADPAMLRRMDKLSIALEHLIREAEEDAAEPVPDEDDEVEVDQ